MSSARTHGGELERGGAADHALRIEHLEVAFRIGRRERRVLSDLSLAIRRGESYGLVGESGCGKSTVALAATRYLARNGRVSGGRILVDGQDLLSLAPRELRRLRARSVAMVYQDPGRALNPSMRIGRQMAEVFEVAAGLGGRAALERAAEMLARVQIASPERVLHNYPHELSGGMQQRVVIAMALSMNPALLILDEPTTGLDATVEAEVLELIARLHAELGNSILFIGHNLPVVARVCDRVGVLYAGELVEEGPAASVFADPRHPYTVGLLRCIPGYGTSKNQGRLETIPGFLPSPGSSGGQCVFAERCANATGRCRSEAPPPVDLGGRLSRCFYPERAPALPRQGATPEESRAPPVPRGGAQAAQGGGPAAPYAVSDGAAPPILRTRNLSKTYRVSGKPLQAVKGVSLDLWAGETLGLVGESGSGKSSLAKLLLGLAAPDAGSEVELAGEPLPALADERGFEQLKSLQIVFQNPGSALNRSQTVRRLIGRALRLAGLFGRAREARLRELAASVRLTPRHLDEKPRQLSGGLKQRVGIARAFAGGPRVVVCDEPTSALDVSVQSAILNLLVDLQAQQGVSYLFISHDLNVVHYVSDRIAVLYLGRLLEIGPAQAVFAGPHHPYTAALLSANPGLENRGRQRIRLSGELPSALNLPSGCVFHTRCPRKLGSICEREEPPLAPAGARHAIRCHIPAAELGAARPAAAPPQDAPAPGG
ncbi:MAG TPA: ABC transporter ATP-binding protein [Steroidobacteraceae bacterium]|nr:ABC transporter ATP-binding protein [Steroidobacteraceae bacterium]